MSEEEINEASVALMRWMDDQEIPPAEAALVMLKTIRFVIRTVSEGDAEKERRGKELFVRMFNEAGE